MNGGTGRKKMLSSNYNLKFFKKRRRIYHDKEAWQQAIGMLAEAGS